MKNKLGKWNKCVAQAKRDLRISSFVPVGGKSVRGQQLQQRAREIRFQGMMYVHYFFAPLKIFYPCDGR
jgi:hypothetical protein